MTTPGTMNAIIDRLTERLAEVKADAWASHKEAMNSYGAGYDAGFVAALQEVITDITGEDAT